MGGIYKYKILKDIELVIQYHEKELSYEGTKQLKLDIIHDLDFNPNLCFLIDLRKAKFKFTDEEIRKYGDFVTENVKLDGYGRVALLTETPNQVAYATIYSLNKNIHTMDYKIFSTLEGAITWLNIDLENLDYIKSEIIKMYGSSD